MTPTTRSGAVKASRVTRGWMEAPEQRASENEVSRQNSEKYNPKYDVAEALT